MAVVYKIINAINEKVYVGSTTDYAHRQFTHLSELRAKGHHNPHLQNAWYKYGEAAFAFAILETCEDELQFVREQYWIDLLEATNRDKGYNIRLRADGHLTHADETKARISAARKGCPAPAVKTRWQDPEYRKQMVEIAKRLATDPEHRQRLSKAQTASWTEERRKAYSDTQKVRQSDPEFRKRMSDRCRGIPKSEITKAKMRAAWIRRKSID